MRLSIKNKENNNLNKINDTNRSNYFINNKNNNNINNNISKKINNNINNSHMNNNDNINNNNSNNINNNINNNGNINSNLNINSNDNIKSINNNEDDEDNDDDFSDISSSSPKLDNSLDSSKFIFNNINEFENQNNMNNMNTLPNNNNFNNFINQQFTNSTNYNNNIKGINNYYEKAINNFLQNANYNINKENNKLNNDLNNTVKNNENSLLKKIEQNSKINLKKNFDINSIKDNMKNKNNILTLNNSGKKNEIINTIPENKNNLPLNIYNNNNIYTNFLNYLTKTILFQNKDLIIKQTRNKGTNFNNINNNIPEKEKNFSSFDEQKNNFVRNNNNINNNNIINNQTLKSDKKDKIQTIYNNPDKQDKNIYLDKDIFKKVRYIKDEEIIDKPLLLNKHFLKMDKNKGSLENKIIELEYFTKRKFDELVREIKYFIPIHFNSHLKDYYSFAKK